MAYCEYCGEKEYNGACTNCHESVYIAQQHVELSTMDQCSDDHCGEIIAATAALDDTHPSPVQAQTTAPSEEQLIAAGLGYPLAKGDALAVWNAPVQAQIPDVDSIANTLIGAWAKAEPCHSITGNPSYVSTFADMAKAVIESLSASEPSNGIVQGYIPVPRSLVERWANVDAFNTPRGAAMELKVAAQHMLSAVPKPPTEG